MIKPRNQNSPTQSPGSSSQATTIVPSPLEGCGGCAYERENTKSRAPSPGCGYPGGPPAHHGRRGCNQWDGTSSQASPVGSYSPCPHSRQWDDTICDEPSPPAAQMSVALAKSPRPRPWLGPLSQQTVTRLRSLTPCMMNHRCLRHKWLGLLPQQTLTP